ncbi:zinc finger protein 395-like isoform X3 [Chaetodon trifascialis]|uniref:zinc finger protein 395-like isoform X3 n=1 Tax=Chaetodon trifascialis TaxID=109706 RepID=UPI0039931DED
MLPKTRLGKRSPLGALVSSACPGIQTSPETGETGVTMATAAGQQTRVKGHPGLKVYFQCGGAGETSGAADQLDLMQSDVSSSSHPSSSSSSCSRSVSSCIDVPRSQRSPEEVDMDELMAAMVLSSLSCSPLLHSPAHPDTAAPLMDCGGGELSDGGSSGYWSVGRTNGSPAPSPPIAEPAVRPTTPPDEGLDMELEQVLFDEPAPRKRRNSVKAAYRCLWPSCGKVLTSVVGIKRHIRTTHLCPPPPSPPSPPSPACGALSRSAPSSSGSFWQVQSEHSYQAPPPSHVMSAAALNTPSCRWTATPTSCLKQGLAFRVRSVSVGEQWLQHQSAPCRRIRGEAKKCRKVYGVEHRDQWCTACRWKKACQRFLD